MQKDERLKLGGNLIKRKEKLTKLRLQVVAQKNRSVDDPIKAYDIDIFVDSASQFCCYIWQAQGIFTSEGSTSDILSSEMRAAGIERCKIASQFMLGIVDAQLAEVEKELEKL